MKFNEVMGHYDYRISNIIRHLHVARDTVNSWRSENYIPFRMQCLIEVLSDGKLKANKQDFVNENS